MYSITQSMATCRSKTIYVLVNQWIKQCRLKSAHWQCAFGAVNELKIQFNWFRAISSGVIMYGAWPNRSIWSGQYSTSRGFFVEFTRTHQSGRNSAAMHCQTAATTAVGPATRQCAALCVDIFCISGRIALPEIRSGNRWKHWLETCPFSYRCWGGGRRMIRLILYFYRIESMMWWKQQPNRKIGHHTGSEVCRRRSVAFHSVCFSSLVVDLSSCHCFEVGKFALGLAS